MPAVDQPLVEVDGREVDKMLVFHFSTMARSQLPCCPLLLSFKQQQTALQEKRTITGDLQYVHIMEGTQFPKGLKLVQQKNKHDVQDAWQPSLLLGGLGRALTGPYSPQGL